MLAVRRFQRSVLVLVLLLSTAFVLGVPPARAARTTPRTDTLLLAGTFNFLVVDNARDRVYVSNPNGTVGVIDASTDAVIAWVPVGSGPTSMDLAFNESELFVSVTGANKMAVVNLTTDRLARSFSLPFQPGDLGAGRPGRAYLTTWTDWDYPRIVDTNTGRVVGSITDVHAETGSYYHDPLLRISRDRSTIFLADRNQAPTQISAVSVATDQATYVGGTPSGINSANDAYVSPDGARFYYANPGADFIQDFSVSNWSELPHLTTGSYPRSVSLSDYGQLAFAVAETQSTLFAFNATSGALRQTFSLSGDPVIVRSLEDGTKAYVITSAGLEVVATGFAAARYPTPQPAALANTTGGYVPLSVAFYSSVMGGQAPYNETWTLGDSTAAYGPAPTHVYAAPGTYAVQLVVRDAVSASGSAGLLISVALPPGPNVLSVATSMGGEAYSPFSNDWVPPDTQVAAGPFDLVEMVNTRYEILNRAGDVLAENAIASIFNVPSSDFLTDPRVVYDASSARFFASLADMTRDTVLLAVSSLDPTQPWAATSFHSNSGCPDQPYLGVMAFVVVLSDNGFSDCTSPTPAYLGAEYWIINKTELLLGSTPHSAHVGPDPALETMFPASVQTSDLDVYLVSVGWAWNVTTSLSLVRITGSPPGPLSFANTTLTVRPVVQPPNGEQPGTTLLVNTGDARVQDAFLRNGDLWISLGDSCRPVGAAVNRSCARVLEIDPAAGLVLQDFDVGAATGDAYYPSLAVDGSGDLLVVYGFSSATAYPGVRVSAQLAGDAPNTTREPLVVRTGAAAAVQTCLDVVSCRYGDYFAASPDPLDPQAVWIAGQYAVSQGWATVIAEVGVFHSARLALSYVITGGGTPPVPPMLVLWSSGILKSVALSTIPQTFAADAGSPWHVEPILLGAAGERWFTTSPFAGIAANGTSEVVAFQHEFLVQLVASPPEGGSVSGLSDWYNNSATLSVTGTAKAGWKLDHWQGNGTGSYSGSAETASLVVSSPITETAVFYPGLTIEVGSGGSVSYSDGDLSGTVPAGTTSTIYLPNGTRVTLTVAPDLLDGFGGWQGGATGNRSSIEIIMDGPGSVRASFTFSMTGGLTVGGIAAILLVAAILTVVLLRRRRRAPPPQPSAVPPRSPPNQPEPPGPVASGPPLPPARPPT